MARSLQSGELDRISFKTPSPDHSHRGSSLSNSYVDPREEELESLLYAARHGELQTILTLLESLYSGSQLNLNASSSTRSHGWTALHWAAYMGHDDIVDLLLKNRASPNVQNGQGDTPLHKAAYTNRCSTVSLLLNANADVSLTNSLGNRASALCENSDVEKLLLAAALSQDKQKEIQLLELVKKGDLRQIQELIDSPHPPSINCIDADGNTALHIASYRGHTHLIIYLMHHGINIHLLNNSKQRAADLAKNIKTQQLLKVEPLQTSVESLQVFQGPLLRKFLLTKFKLVWVVMNLGCLDIYPYKDQQMSVSKRSLISRKELVNCSVCPSKKDKLTFKVIYDNDSDDIFRIPMETGFDEDTEAASKCELTREMWKNAFTSHTDYMNKRSPMVIIDRADKGVNFGGGRINSLSEEIQIAEAHMSVFQKHTKGVNDSAQRLFCSGTNLDPGLVSLVRQLQDTLTLAVQTKTQMMKCLNTLHQQEDISQLLAHEVEKNRILEESLNIIASENESLHDLCRSTTVNMEARSQFFSGSHYLISATPADEYEDALSTLSPRSENGFLFDEGMQSISLKPGVKPLLDQNLKEGILRNAKYRNSLPAAAPAIQFSVWSILKSCIGKDLSRISMPVFLNEPLSMLQRIAESLESSMVFKKVLDYEDPLVRIQMIAGKLILSQISQIYRFKKPFNPVLGETFEFVDEEELKLRFIAEQVSHHPPIGAFHCKGEGFESHATIQAAVSFWGKSVEISPVGGVTIKLDNGDVYTANNVTTIVHNIIIGKMWIEKYGVMEVTNHTTKDKCILNFKPGGWFGKDLHWVEGYVLEGGKQRRYIVQGRWPHEMWSYPTSGTVGDPSPVDGENGGTLIYKCTPTSAKERDYFLSKLAMNLNHFLPGMDEKLPPTDSRHRADIRALEEGDIEAAGTHKHRIEEKQREARKVRETANTKWKPRWFELKKNPYTDTKEWCSNGKYWERDFSNCSDIF